MINHQTEMGIYKTLRNYYDKMQTVIQYQADTSSLASFEAYIQY